MADAALLKKQTNEYWKARAAFFKAARAAHVATKTLKYGQTGAPPKLVSKLLNDAVRWQNVVILAEVRLLSAQAELAAAWRGENGGANG